MSQIRFMGVRRGAIAIGSVLGGLLAGILSRRLKSTYNIIGCALCILAGGIALKALPSAMGIFGVLTVSCSLLMVLSTLLQIQMMSYVQILTPDDLIGKVISCIICICMCSNPIGRFIYGIIFEHIGEYSYLPFCFAAIIVIIIIGLFSRRLFAAVENELKQSQTS